MRTISARALQAMLSRETDEIPLQLLRVTHPDLQPIKIVCDTNFLERTDGIYNPVIFDLKLVTDSDDQVAKLPIMIENIDPDIVETLNGLVTPATVELELVLAATPNVTEVGPLKFKMVSASCNETSISCEIAHNMEILEQLVPFGVYGPNNSAGVFV